MARVVKAIEGTLVFGSNISILSDCRLETMHSRSTAEHEPSGAELAGEAEDSESAHSE